MLTFDGIPMPYAKDLNCRKPQSTQSIPDCSRLISPMSVLDNVENFVIDVAVVPKTKQVPAARNPLPVTLNRLPSTRNPLPTQPVLPAKSDQITRRGQTVCLNFDSLESTTSALDPLTHILTHSHTHTLISPGLHSINYSVRK